MASSYNGPHKVQTFEHFAQERLDKDVESSTSVSSHAKELPLRTSLVRDSMKKKIFAYMDKGDRSADIELESGLSHPRVKHYRPCDEKPELFQVGKSVGDKKASKSTAPPGD
ncbi:hypothetical protein HO133_007854 [Letharia lupina]|uniref:Uncharacterized protein n=1 Tax=Letharia lupina TaxID=560253 RepID=A0A8H6FHA9_9LECA|nr:uncharacterized protein HO133_007854 [Letharia lupina]KAF6228126.1 hypothetical protein HO133_007854 [Letharia lupina]